MSSTEKLNDVPWQRGVPLPCRAELSVTDEKKFQVRCGVGVFPGVVVDMTYSGLPEAWSAIGLNGERIWAAAIPSDMD